MNEPSETQAGDVKAAAVAALKKAKQDAWETCCQHGARVCESCSIDAVIAVVRRRTPND